MNVEVENEQATVEEAVGVLLQHLPASKVARLLSVWQVGRGNYLQLRDKLFPGETVESLYRKAASAK